MNLIDESRDRKARGGVGWAKPAPLGQVRIASCYAGMTVG